MATSTLEKIYTVKIKPDTEPHIKINQDICIICKNKDCTKFCPSMVFNWSNKLNELLISYENCLECGACKMGCPYESIGYSHPKPGYGIS